MVIKLTEKAKKWEEYQMAYNTFSDILQNCGIDYKLLRNVIDLHEAYLDCNHSFYQSGD